MFWLLFINMKIQYFSEWNWHGNYTNLNNSSWLVIHSDTNQTLRHWSWMQLWCLFPTFFLGLFSQPCFSLYVQQHSSQHHQLNSLVINLPISKAMLIMWLLFGNLEWQSHTIRTFHYLLQIIVRVLQCFAAVNKRKSSSFTQLTEKLLVNRRTPNIYMKVSTKWWHFPACKSSSNKVQSNGHSRAKVFSLSQQNYVQYTFKRF